MLHESKSIAVLVLTHFVNPTVIDVYKRLKVEVPENHDVYLVLSVGDGPIQTLARADVSADRLYAVNDAKLFNPAYTERCSPESLSHILWRKAGNADLMSLCFAADHPQYNDVWCVEYDVHFEGNWAFFFDRFAGSDADLLGTLLGPVEELPLNVQTMPPVLRDEAGIRPTPSDTVVGFFPIYRMSRALLKTIDAAYRAGWNGHYEFSFGTLAKRHGLRIEDIGGDGPFVQPCNKNVFYFANRRRWDKSPGTFVFRPSFSSVQHRENTLWHPLKPVGNYFNHSPPADKSNPLAWIKSYGKAAYYYAAVTLWFRTKWRPAAQTPVPTE